MLDELDDNDLIEQYNHKAEEKTGLLRYAGRKSLIEIIHEQVKLNNNAEAGNHNPCKFYPSSAGKCSRAIVYQMMGYDQEPFDGRTLLIFGNGNSMHNRMEHLFDDTGLLIAPELSFEKAEWRISGRSDAVIRNFLPHEPSDTIIKLYEPVYKLNEDGSTWRDPVTGFKEVVDQKLLYEGPDNDVIIVELKSISDKGFGNLDRYPKDYHFKQLQLYLYLTGIKCGMLLYENKNTQELKEVFVPYDEAAAKVVTDQIILVNKCIDDNVLPPKEYERTDYECRYCNYNHICWPVRNVYNIANVMGEA